MNWLVDECVVKEWMEYYGGGRVLVGHVCKIPVDHVKYISECEICSGQLSVLYILRCERRNIDFKARLRISLVIYYFFRLLHHLIVIMNLILSPNLSFHQNFMINRTSPPFEMNTRNTVNGR